MTLRESVKELQKRGINITYYERKDGGIVVTSINGTKYRGKTGNKVVRFMMNQELSSRRASQLSRITRQRNWSSPRIESTEDMNRQLKRVQRLWRKEGIRGTISKRNLKIMIQERGFEGAKTYLIEMERHARGLAYNSQIDGLIARMEQDLVNIHDENEQSLIQSVIDKLKANRDNISFEDVTRIYDELYNYEQDSIGAGAFAERVNRILS